MQDDNSCRRNPLDGFLPSGNDRLDAQLKFTAIIDKMTSVMRRTQLLDMSRSENDAEHSWHISVMAMLFQEYAIEKPDVNRAIQMALVHDLIEIYAGDTFAYDVEGYQDKEAREKAAADRLFAELPPDQGKFVRELWEEFDARCTPDARYAACMDVLQPVFHNTLTEGYTWRFSGKEKVRVEQVLKRTAIIKEVMPVVYQWIEKAIEHAIQQGWIEP